RLRRERARPRRGWEGVRPRRGREVVRPQRVREGARRRGWEGVRPRPGRKGVRPRRGWKGIRAVAVLGGPGAPAALLALQPGAQLVDALAQRGQLARPLRG